MLLFVAALPTGAAPPVPAAEAPDPAATLEKVETLEAQAAGAPVSPESVEPITEVEAEVIDPEGQQPLEDALTCLARTIYWEAKGEGEEGMIAVANVVMNRLADDRFPNRICAVVTEGQPDGPCQFSWWCDGNPLEVEEPDRYALTTEIARQALNGDLADLTLGALFFHHLDVAPDWAQDFEPTATIGPHRFYRPVEEPPRE